MQSFPPAFDLGWILRPRESSEFSFRADIGNGVYVTPSGNDLHVFLDVPIQVLSNESCDIDRLPCLYTFESTICYYPFQYQVASDRSVNFLQFDSDEETDDLLEMVDVSPRTVQFGLTPMTDRVIELVRLLNQGCDLSVEEEVEFASATYCCSEVGPDIESYADVFSQVGGLETFLPQRPDRPICFLCQQPMRLLTALAGNARLGTTFIPDSIQVVFHVCFGCTVIDAAHFA